MGKYFFYVKISYYSEKKSSGMQLYLAVQSVYNHVAVIVPV